VTSCLRRHHRKLESPDEITEWAEQWPPPAPDPGFEPVFDPRSPRYRRFLANIGELDPWRPFGQLRVWPLMLFVRDRGRAARGRDRTVRRSARARSSGSRVSLPIAAPRVDGSIRLTVVFVGRRE
jgi:hypothetical protein